MRIEERKALDKLAVTGIGVLAWGRTDIQRIFELAQTYI